ncbi:MAG: PepSY domain-containing protein, partial [Acidobacteriaceae bacterium]|nr:PepSY domain-containing protein [Acidobacteriaceae bacterium]
MSRPHAILKAFRFLHLYIGVFITPALIFFAFTGAMQTFSLHETTPGSSYKPPAWIVTLAQIHKKQTPVVPIRKPFPRPAVPAPATADHAAASPVSPAPAPAAPARKHHPLPMKIFFLLVSIGLFISALTGIYMAWKFTRNKAAIAAVLLAGI